MKRIILKLPLKMTFKQELKIIKTFMKLSLTLLFALQLIGCNKNKPIIVKKITAEEIKNTPLVETAEQTTEQALEKGVEKTKDIAEKEATQKQETPVSSQQKAISDNPELAGNTQAEDTGTETLTMNRNTWPVVSSAPPVATPPPSQPVTSESSTVSITKESSSGNRIKTDLLPLTKEMKYDKVFSTFKRASQKPCENLFCLFVVPFVSPDPLSKDLEYFIGVRIKNRENGELPESIQLTLTYQNTEEREEVETFVINNWELIEEEGLFIKSNP